MLARADGAGMCKCFIELLFYIQPGYTVHTTVLFQFLGVLLALRFGDELCV